MLGSRNAVGGAVERILRSEIGGIILIEQLNGCERVRTEKIEEMRGASDGGGFPGGNAAETEIVQLEGKQGRSAGANQRFADDLLEVTRECGDGDGIQDVQENGLDP